MKSESEKYHLASNRQNRGCGAGSSNYRHGNEKPKIASTLQHETQHKNEIILTAEQRKIASWLYRQAGQPSPTWLRRRFKITRKRLSSINELWSDAGLDGKFCHLLCGDDEWSGLLHQVWHLVHGDSQCT